MSLSCLSDRVTVATDQYFLILFSFFSPGVKLHAIHFLVASVAGAKRGGRGGGRKARKRGKGKEPLSALPPSLFPVFPIPYDFRRLLRRLLSGRGNCC